MHEPNLASIIAGLPGRFDLVYIGEQRTQVGVFEIVHSHAVSCHNAFISAANLKEHNPVSIKLAALLLSVYSSKPG